MPLHCTKVHIKYTEYSQKNKKTLNIIFWNQCPVPICLWADSVRRRVVMDRKVQCRNVRVR